MCTLTGERWALFYHKKVCTVKHGKRMFFSPFGLAYFESLLARGPWQDYYSATPAHGTGDMRSLSPGLEQHTPNSVEAKSTHSALQS